MATESVSAIRISGATSPAPDYTTLSAWEAAEQADIVTADQIAVAECYDDWTSGLDDNVGIAGWTTDSTRYIHIRPKSGQGHGGTIGGGFYLADSGNSYTIRPVNDTLLTDLEVRQTSSNAVGCLAYAAGATGNVIVDRCIFSTNSGQTGTTETVVCDGPNVTFRNTLIYGYKRSLECRDSTTLIENCVLWRHADQLGLVADNGTTTYNTYSGKASGTQEDFWDGGPAPTGSHNASSDTTATVDYTSSLISKAGSSNFSSVTAGSENFHLSGTGVDLYNAGTDRSTNFTLDIDGDTWSNWSIGVDEANPGGGGVTPIPPPLQKTDNQFATIIAHRLGGVLQ